MATATVPGDLDTARGPPLRVPLAHFLVGLALGVAGATLGVLASLDAAPVSAGVLTDAVPAFATVARAHLLLTGWVCVTIMGAMTQFVPVWSGFVACLLAGWLDLLWIAGLVILAGFWTFVYNTARTLAAARPWDSTEVHFAVALGFLMLVSLAGLTLAVGFVRNLAPLGIDRAGLRGAHLTLAVPGVVLTTVFGALYQLAPMFTNTEPDGLDAALRRVESVAFPLGVLALAAGRLVATPGLARVGAVATGLGIAAFAAVLVRTLARARAERTPTLTRYALVAPALVGWLALAAPVWFRDPLAAGAALAARSLELAGSTALLAGSVVFAANLLLVVHGHVEDGLRGLVTGPADAGVPPATDGDASTGPDD